ncbi:MAG: tetratricopeptide repeat protein [Peptococcaceae bacterium]|nr:tetratricopeptide repeat protein [Peptococcaceae bacterium]
MASLRKWQIHLETGIKYLGEGNSMKAEGYLKESLEVAEELDVPVIIAFSQRLLATAQVRNNKLDEAEKGFFRALQFCQELNNNKGISEAKAGLASVCFVRGEYQQAVMFYKEAIGIYPQDSSPLRLAVLYSDLGQVYGRMKKWNKAESVFLKAVSFCIDQGYSRGEAEINLYLGEIYYSQGKTQLAQDKFAKSARLFAIIDDELSLANALSYLAFILWEKNMIEEALLFQYRVVALYLKHDQRLEISESYYLISNILQYAGLLDEAESCLKYSLQYYNGIEFGLAVRYQSLAVIAIAKKEYEDAKNFYYNALKFYQYYGDGSRIGEISEELTYLIKYDDVCIKENLYKLLNGRNVFPEIPKHEIMVKLAQTLMRKGNNLAALRCGWRALEIAKAMKYETQEIEMLIQNLSVQIRKKK